MEHKEKCCNNCSDHYSYCCLVSKEESYEDYENSDLLLLSLTYSDKTGVDEFHGGPKLLSDVITGNGQLIGNFYSNAALVQI